MVNNQKSFWWFLSGAAAFHALTHIFYWASGSIPLDFKLFVVTPTLNQIELWFSIILAALFAYIAKSK